VHSVRALEAKEWASSENFVKAKVYFESYKKDELPKMFPMNYPEKHFLNRNYGEVENELYEIGFENIELIRKTEKQLLSKEGSVTNLDINGNDKYREGEWVSADSKVELTYYLPFSEDEIAAMHPGEIKLPNGIKSYIGKQYQEVETEIIELGFINVYVEEIRDITKDRDKNEGKVAGITIDKSPKYAKGEWVSENAEVKITYHAKK
jgi:hypothetical protein